MRKTLVIGKNSFLASRFLSLARFPERYLAVSHKQAFDQEIYRRISCVVNFSIHPDYRTQPYVRYRDMDLQIAKMICRSGPSDARFVMLSSRSVYAPEVSRGAQEEITGEAATVYGQNKRVTERNLVKTLGERASLLRIGNVIGDEQGTGRSTFMAQALDRLVSKKEIVLDVSPTVCRDFLPDQAFARVLEAVCENPPPGALNVGSGIPIPVGSVARWLIEGYGEGTLRISNHRRHDEFWLDVTRLHAHCESGIQVAEIANHCRVIGARLRRCNSGNSPEHNFCQSYLK